MIFSRRKFHRNRGSFGLEQTNHTLAFGVEPLESRRMLAGNVQVDVHGDDIHIHGDRYDNEIVVTLNNAGEVVVKGRDDTLINGEGEFNTEVTSLDDLKIKMKKGDDVVKIRGLQRQYLPYMALVVEGDLTIKTGRGDDFVRVGEILDCDDECGIEECEPSVIVGGHLKVHDTKGHNEINLLGFEVEHDLKVITGHGYDEIEIVCGLVEGETWIKTKGGYDTLDVDFFEGIGEVNVKMGGGEDVLRIGFLDAAEGSVILDGTVTICMGGGDDTVVIYPDSIIGDSDDVKLKGNAGEDTLDTFGKFGDFPDFVDVTGFPIII